MKSNKIGTYVKRNVNGLLTKLFGIVKIEQTQSRHSSGVKLAEDACLDSQAKKTLHEAEVKKSQALELVRRFQNC